MNTMKREDMVKEKLQLEATVLGGVMRAAFPVVSWISAVQRLMYLCNQIDISTPKGTHTQPPIKMELHPKPEATPDA